MVVIHTVTSGETSKSVHLALIVPSYVNRTENFSIKQFGWSNRATSVVLAEADIRSARVDEYTRYETVQRGLST